MSSSRLLQRAPHLSYILLAISHTARKKRSTGEPPLSPKKANARDTENGNVTGARVNTAASIGALSFLEETLHRSEGLACCPRSHANLTGDGPAREGPPHQGTESLPGQQDVPAARNRRRTCRPVPPHAVGPGRFSHRQLSGFLHFSFSILRFFFLYFFFLPSSVEASRLDPLDCKATP